MHNHMKTYTILTQSSIVIKIYVFRNGTMVVFEMFRILSTRKILRVKAIA